MVLLKSSFMFKVWVETYEYNQVSPLSEEMSAEKYRDLKMTNYTFLKIIFVIYEKITTIC